MCDEPVSVINQGNISTRNRQQTGQPVTERLKRNIHPRDGFATVTPCQRRANILGGEEDIRGCLDLLATAVSLLKPGPLAGVIARITFNYPPADFPIAGVIENEDTFFKAPFITLNRLYYILGIRRSLEAIAVSICRHPANQHEIAIGVTNKYGCQCRV